MTARARHVSLAAAACLLLIAGVAAAATIATLRSDAPATPRIVADGATLALGDDDGGSALFTLPAAKPGESVTRCIRITYDGSPGQAVRLSAVAAGPGTLAPHLDLDVDVGTGGSFADCAGFSGTRIFSGTLADLQANHADYDHGLTGFVPSAAEPSKTFRLTTRVHDTNAAQGQTAGVTFAWTAADTGTPAPPPPPAPTADPTPSPDPTPPPVDATPAEVTATPAPTTTAPAAPTTTTPTRTPQSPPTRQPTDGGAPDREPQGDSTGAPTVAGTPAPTADAGADTGSAVGDATVGGSAPERASGGSNAGASPSHRANRPRAGAPAGPGPGAGGGITATAPKSVGQDSGGILHRVLGSTIGETVDKVATAVADAAGPVAERSAFPLVLLLVMVLFLAVQNAIDRRDPKLALAPLRSEDLPFTDDPSDQETETP